MRLPIVARKSEAIEFESGFNLVMQEFYILGTYSGVVAMGLYARTRSTSSHRTHRDPMRKQYRTINERIMRSGSRLRGSSTRSPADSPWVTITRYLYYCRQSK